MPWDAVPEGVATAYLDLTEIAPATLVEFIVEKVRPFEDPAR